MGGQFQTTRWSLIVAAAGTSPEAREALASLCEAYWSPLYAYVRSCGYDTDQARDLTQSYFLQFLEKDFLKDVSPEHGRFRSFLLASLKHFLSKERIKMRALKRGGATFHVDPATAERQYRVELADNLTPEQMFERRWALEVLGRVVRCLRDEFEAAGRLHQFDKLKPCLMGEESRSYRQLAMDLDMSEAAVKVAVHRLRRKFGRLLREEIGQTVADRQEVDGEIRYLLSVIGNRRPHHG